MTDISGSTSQREERVAPSASRAEDGTRVSASREVDLWHRARRGDAGARSELSQIVVAAASHKLRRLGSLPGSEFDDLLQEVVAEAFRRVSDDTLSSPRQSVRIFVRWLAFGVWMRHCRQRRPQQLPSSESLEEAIGAPDSADPRRIAQRNEMLSGYRVCRDRLQERDRLLVASKIELGLGPKETAGRFRMTPDSVRMRVFRALAKIRRCLRSKGLLR